MAPLSSSAAANHCPVDNAKTFPLGQAMMQTAFGWISVFVMCAPLTMFITLRDCYDDPKKTPGRWGPKQKNMIEE